MNRNMAHSHIGLNGDPCVVCAERWQDFTPPPFSVRPQPPAWFSVGLLSVFLLMMFGLVYACVAFAAP